MEFKVLFSEDPEFVLRSADEFLSSEPGPRWASVASAWGSCHPSVLVATEKFESALVPRRSDGAITLAEEMWTNYFDPNYPLDSQAARDMVL
jgi:hypothetical protein